MLDMRTKRAYSNTVFFAVHERFNDADFVAGFCCTNDNEHSY